MRTCGTRARRRRRRIRFARGEPVALPPLDANGNGTRTVRLERPLDFAAVTDHSEFLGEVESCTTPGSPTYDSASCQMFRDRPADRVCEPSASA